MSFPAFQLVANGDVYGATTSRQNVDASRAQLDQEISAIANQITAFQARMRELKTKRNELSPVSRPPPEVICKIFAEIRSSLGDSKFLWTSILRVCRRWRYAALDQATFWSDVSDVDVPLAMVPTMIGYSKQAPLKLYLESGEPSMVVDPDVEEEIRKALASETTRLEELSLCGTADTLDGRLLSLGPLYDYTLSWTSPFLPNLTDFEFIWLKPLHMRPFAPQSLFDILAVMPNLELLHLNYPIRTFRDVPSDRNQIVRFPRLKKLSMHGSPAEWSDFMKHIAVPVSAELRLDYHSYIEEDIGDRFMPFYLLNPSTIPGQQPSPVDFNVAQEEGGNAQRGRVVLSGRGCREPGNAATRLLECIPLHQVRSIHLESFDIALRPSFLRCPLVEHIAISAPALGRFTTALLDDPAFNPQPNSGAVPHCSYLPSLKSLSLAGVRFTEAPCIAREEEDHTMFFDMLFSMIHARANNGGKVEVLKIEQCINLTRERVESLRRCVGEVVWDGVETEELVDCGSEYCYCMTGFPEDEDNDQMDVA
ncbi:hypothetical protein CC1G_05438 [Coprinopsis cinerea okayama7|uniref:Uncharacterized protein n=1 Tax=Coprinopsis cinerea (strain Okayama-7 / 130 / ATCC MYA-4618 / FGSC 9003) TaxID=240176 RepID=A8NQ41_COPC7|nr:hypothetical protein CC1G_05438 [Coprinopsis cinerea okayama7\|eukprot:XP_001835476.2 hypothetical protein CC1G_05438 [Coprinopsis cinerea okayama7\